MSKNMTDDFSASRKAARSRKQARANARRSKGNRRGDYTGQFSTQYQIDEDEKAGYGELRRRSKNEDLERRLHGLQEDLRTLGRIELSPDVDGIGYLVKHIKAWAINQRREFGTSYTWEHLGQYGKGGFRIYLGQRTR